MNAYFQIARNTFRETLRQPVFFLVLAAMLVLVFMIPYLALFVFGEAVKLVVDSALASLLLFGWVAAVLAAGHSISREIQNGTVQLVLSKPVTRYGFIIAKIAGILAALTLFSFIGAIASWLVLRAPEETTGVDSRVMIAYGAAFTVGCLVGGVANFIARVAFTMTAILAMCITFPVALLGVVLTLPVTADNALPLPGSFAAACVLAWLAVLAMGALATALSTRLELVPNLLACAVVFQLGLISDYVFGRAAAGNPLAWLAHNLLPNWQLFWMADALAACKPIPWSYVGLGAVYIAIFIVFFTLLAMLLFRTREVGGQARR